MNLTDELERLGKLHKDGLLTEQEFIQAKSRLLNQPSEPEKAESPELTLGLAANRYVTMQMIWGVIGLVIFLIFFFGLIYPHFTMSTSSASKFLIDRPLGKSIIID